MLYSLMYPSRYAFLFQQYFLDIVAHKVLLGQGCCVKAHQVFVLVTG